MFRFDTTNEEAIWVPEFETYSPSVTPSSSRSDTPMRHPFEIVQDDITPRTKYDIWGPKLFLPPAPRKDLIYRLKDPIKAATILDIDRLIEKVNDSELVRAKVHEPTIGLLN